ncbi:unnamed protein product, partial [Gulo gulo]
MRETLAFAFIAKICSASRRGDFACCRWRSCLGEGSWDVVLQSKLYGVSPASEAALQWGVKC